MHKEQAIDLLDNLIGMVEDNQDNDYDTALRMAIDALKAQLFSEGTTSDTISRKEVKYKLTALVNEFEEILAHIREREVNDSVCGLCEYDGTCIGQSGDWCNECPGFDKDDCFKLSNETRKKWTDEIIKALPTVQPEPHWIPCEDCERRCEKWGNLKTLQE